MKRVFRAIYAFVEDVVYGAGFFAGAVYELIRITFRRREE